MTNLIPSTLSCFIFLITINHSTQLFFGGGGCGGRNVYQPPPCSCSPIARPTYSSPCASANNYYQRPVYQQPQPAYYAPQKQSYIPPPPISSHSTYEISTPRSQVYIKPTTRVTPEVGYTEDSNTPLIIEKSLKSLTDQDSLSTFESSLETYKMQNRGGLRRAQAAKQIDFEDGEKCSSIELKKIILEAISENVSISKLRISQKAKKIFGYNFDVICSEHDFSYLISSNIHCRVQRYGLICLAYEN